MDAVEQLRRLFVHLSWADDQLLSALGNRTADDTAFREYTHIIAVEALWLDRLLQRPHTIAPWPTLSPQEVASLRSRTMAGYNELLARLQPEELRTRVSYVNSAGVGYTNATGDILLHVAMHGQYHRGKVNLLLRQTGEQPAPVDFIAYVRGAPAATEADARATLHK